MKTSRPTPRRAGGTRRIRQDQPRPLPVLAARQTRIESYRIARACFIAATALAIVAVLMGGYVATWHAGYDAGVIHQMEVANG